MNENEERYEKQMMLMQAALRTEGGKLLINQLKAEIMREELTPTGQTMKEGKIAILRQYNAILDYEMRLK